MQYFKFPYASALGTIERWQEYTDFRPLTKNYKF